jgi:hypothetical protein
MGLGMDSAAGRPLTGSRVAGKYFHPNVPRNNEDELADEEEKVGTDAAAERPVLGSYPWGEKIFVTSN